MKKHDGLQWRQRYITQLGCIKGGLDFLGRDISFPWLYGGTGYAFVLNIEETLYPSGPTCWDTQPIFDLAPNLGYQVSGITIEKAKAGDTFPEKQSQAWEFVRSSLERGQPCYGWELQPYIPDYYIINGYNDGDDHSPAGYYFSGWVSGGPCDWHTLGEMDVQVLQVYCIDLVEPEPDEKVVKDALTIVIQHSATASGWFSNPGYATGPAGFDLWAQSVESGLAIRDGHSYNAATWLECREMAVGFLHEACQRLPNRCDELFYETADRYGDVCEQLTKILTLSPFYPETWDNETRLQSTEAASILRKARDAELLALEGLKQILARL
jgi:hypothetical protein